MQGNWNFVWHCLIGWIFFWARGGQLYARTRFIVNLGVCLFFLLPLQNASENAWLLCLDMQWCRAFSTAKDLENKVSRSQWWFRSYDFYSSCFNQPKLAWLFSMSQTTWAFWTEGRGVLVSMTPDGVANVESARVQRPGQHRCCSPTHAPPVWGVQDARKKSVNWNKRPGFIQHTRYCLKLGWIRRS